MSQGNNRSVFVGNISYTTTGAELRELFSEVGPVVDFHLVLDPATGKSKGYGFCEYSDAATAMSAMRNLNGREFQGRPLRVDFTEDRSPEPPTLAVKRPREDVPAPEPPAKRQRVWTLSRTDFTDDYKTRHGASWSRATAPRVFRTKDGAWAAEHANQLDYLRDWMGEMWGEKEYAKYFVGGKFHEHSKDDKVDDDAIEDDFDDLLALVTAGEYVNKTVEWNVGEVELED